MARSTARRLAAVLFLTGGFLFLAGGIGYAYFLLGYSWSGSSADYRINANFPEDPGGTDEQQIAAIQAAAIAWHNQGDVTFAFDYEGTTTVDYVDVFDSTNAVFYTTEFGGGVLATCFYVGDIFDNMTGFDIVFWGDYSWNGVGDAEGAEYDIGAVATHELGHGLGLGHSSDFDATMYAFYIGIEGRTLADDDIDGVQALYSSSSTAVGTPQIDEVDPPVGPPEGGNEVILHGENFTWESDTELEIDGVALDSDDWTLENGITIVIESMPAHDPGVVSIGITNELGTVLVTEAYTYLGTAPTIATVTPNAGAIGGGTAITILGADFESDVEVLIGGNPLGALVLVDDGQIEGVTPAGSASGAVDVVVTQSGGSDTLVDGFTYSSALLQVETTTHAPGSINAEVRIYAEHEIDLDGYSMGVDFDGQYLDVVEVTTDGTDADGAGFVAPILNNAGGASGSWWTLGVLVDLSPPLTESVAASDESILAIAKYDISASAPLGGVALMELRGDLGTPEVALSLVSDSTELVPATIDGLIFFEGVTFVRGDGDGNESLLINDAIIILNHLYSSGPLACQDVADIDDDGALGLTDPILLLGYMFSSGPAPAEPFPDPGSDPTLDALICD
ncbi:MAG: matrixin family metalloprotease [Planctomycetes bacterium]|nr:matrixin family metalloprotease [Planctomycetota bacterium]